MNGMNSTTGAALDGLDHLRQSIRDILTTPIGSRVMRRDYGSNIFDLIDQPGTPANLLRVYAATVGAIKRWEPRVRVRRVLTSVTADGVLEVQVLAQVVDTGSALVVPVLLEFA